MYEYEKTPEQKFSVVKFKMCLIDYRTWGLLVFFLEAPLQGGLTGLPKWESRACTVVYIGHYPFHSWSVALVLNTITGHVSPQCHVVFDDTVSTVEHMSKGTVPGNWKNLVEYHS